MKGVIRSVVFMLWGLILFSLCTGCGNTSSSEKKVVTPETAPKSLFAYVGAGLKEPVTEIAQIYEQKTGVKIELTFNNSGMLLNQLETMKKGDIYMPGGMPYVKKAQQKGHVEEMVGPIAIHTPVIVTPKGNPGHISKVQDLAEPGVKLVMPEKDSTALGKATFRMFDKLGIAQQVEKNVLTNVETAPKVPTTIIMGQGNAGITEYSNYAKHKDKLEIIEIDPAVNEVEEIPCAMITYSDQKDQTRDFLEFIKVEGPAIFKKYGFKINV